MDFSKSDGDEGFAKPAVRRKCYEWRNEINEFLPSLLANVLERILTSMPWTHIQIFAVRSLRQTKFRDQLVHKCLHSVFISLHIRNVWLNSTVSFSIVDDFCFELGLSIVLSVCSEKYSQIIVIIVVVELCLCWETCFSRRSTSFFYKILLFKAFYEILVSKKWWFFELSPLQFFKDFL